MEEKKGQKKALPPSIVELEKMLDEATEKLGRLLHRQSQSGSSDRLLLEMRSLRLEIDRLEGAINLEYCLFRGLDD